MADKVDGLAEAVADASVELRGAIAARSAAKKARQVEFRRYADEHGEDAAWYPLVADQYETPITDARCDSAIADFLRAQEAVRKARGKWRRATTRYARIGGAA